MMNLTHAPDIKFPTVFVFLEDYLNLTTNQYMRVKDNREKISSLSEHTWELHDTLNIMFGDLHFLLIAIDKAYC